MSNEPNGSLSWLLGPVGDYSCELCLETLQNCEAFQCSNDHFFCKSCIETEKHGCLECVSCDKKLFLTKAAINNLPTSPKPVKSQQSKSIDKQHSSQHSEPSTATSSLQHFSHVVYQSGIYNGQMDGDKRTGRGEMRYSSGEVYSGEWLDNKRSGQGKATYPHGEMFVGSWLNNVRNGPGVSNYSNGDSFTGRWSNGVRHGRGTFSYACGVTTEGVWVTDTQTITDKVTCKDGSVYVGEMNGLLRHGTGEMRFENGDVYTGTWLNDLRHGMGSQWYAANKSTYTGLWHHDQPVNGSVVSSQKKRKSDKLSQPAARQATSHKKPHVTLAASDKLTVFCTDIPRSVAEYQLRAHFEKFGPLAEVKLLMSRYVGAPHHKYSPQTLVQFATHDGATKCLEAVNHVVDGHSLKVVVSHFNIAPLAGESDGKKKVDTDTTLVTLPRDSHPAIEATHTAVQQSDPLKTMLNVCSEDELDVEAEEGKEGCVVKKMKSGVEEQKTSTNEIAV